MAYGKLEIIEVTTNKRGDGNINIKYSKGFKNFVKKRYSKSRITKKLIRRFIIESISDNLEL